MITSSSSLRFASREEAQRRTVLAEFRFAIQMEDVVLIVYLVRPAAMVSLQFRREPGLPLPWDLQSTATTRRRRRSERPPRTSRETFRPSHALVSCTPSPFRGFRQRLPFP